MRYFLFTAVAALSVMAQIMAQEPRTIAEVVQIDDAGNTIPPYSVATPGQVNSLRSTANSVYESAEGIDARITECEQAVIKLSTNLVVTSTVYVQSVGGVPYDPEGQTIHIYSIQKTGNTITIKATMEQSPLVPPALDFRTTLGTNDTWEAIASSVTKIQVPAGVTAADAYQFDLALPNPTSAFFRVIDNSTGASGSGLYWLVYGGVYVDGKKGYTGTVNGHKFVGGILVENEPL